MPKPKSVELAVKQLRQAASNLEKAEQDHNATSFETREFIRAARVLVNHVANALSFGGTYKVVGRAEDMDKAGEKVPDAISLYG